MLACDDLHGHFGVSESVRDVSSVSSVWRVPESHRWRLEVTPAKRKRVRFKVNVETDEVERDAFGMPIRVVVEIVDRAVVEQPRLRGGSRASVGSSASRLTHCGTMHDSRCVILGDNLAAVLCFARARSCDFRLCVQVCRLCAFTASADMSKIAEAYLFRRYEPLSTATAVAKLGGRLVCDIIQW